MPMSARTIETFNYIIDEHNKGSSDSVRASEFECNVASIRVLLSLAKKFGSTVQRQRRGRQKMTREEKAILGAAMREAHRKIAEMHSLRQAAE